MTDQVQPLDVNVLVPLSVDPRWRFGSDHTSLCDPAIDTSVTIGHRHVTDFHLVNLAARHDAALATFDSSLPLALTEDDRRHVAVLPVS